MRLTALLALLLAALLAGCGGRSNPEAPSGGAESAGGTVGEADVAQVLQAEQSADTACGLIKDAAGSTMPLTEAVPTLIRVLRQQPTGVIIAGVSTRARNMKTVVGDVARRLETCPNPNPSAARELRAALAKVGSS